MLSSGREEAKKPFCWGCPQTIYGPIVLTTIMDRFYKISGQMKFIIFLESPPFLIDASNVLDNAALSCSFWGTDCLGRPMALLAFRNYFLSEARGGGWELKRGVSVSNAIP